MKHLILPIIIMIILGSSFLQKSDNRRILDYKNLNVNNINAFFYSSGIINQDKRTQNTPGFEWPKGSTKHACFTAGPTLAGYINGQYAMTAASYGGEYAPGYVLNGNFVTNPNFHVYKVTEGDNSSSNPDWANWGLMVPFGAPFKDNNNNGIYEPEIDYAGFPGASQTLFLCMSDADSGSHNAGEGFGGGVTDPLLKSEVHMTAWAYTKNTLSDVQFIKWEIINKNTNAWDSLIFSVVCDPDLGDGNDDYIGCDTTIDLGFCYNADNDDPVYGQAPPAFGMVLLRGAYNRQVVPNIPLGMNTFDFFTNTGSSPPPCESDPNGEPIPAYNFMKGFKKDLTPWLNVKIPLGQGTRKTKFTYPWNLNWTESNGSIKNCGGDTLGQITANPSGDRRFVISSGPVKVMPNDTQTIIISQFVARGSSNLNSVTKLFPLADYIRSVYESGFNVGINAVNSEIPENFELLQNYPNPFNPVTKIKFSIPAHHPNGGVVTLKIFDILGREVMTLVNEPLQAGVYETTFDGSAFSSGIYFYRLSTDKYSETRKMILLK